MQTERDVGELGSIRERRLEAGLGEADLALAAADQALELGHGVAEVQLGELVEVVPVQPALERIGQQHGVVERRHGNVAEPPQRALDVMADLEHAGIGEQRRQLLEGCRRRQLLERRGGREVEAAGARRRVAERHVAGIAVTERERDADQGRLDARAAGRHRQPDITLLAGARDPAVERGRVLHQRVARRHLLDHVGRRRRHRGAGLGAAHDQAAVEALDQLAELLRLEKRAQGLGVGRALDQGVDRHRQVDIVAERDQGEADARVLLRDRRTG